MGGEVAVIFLDICNQNVGWSANIETEDDVVEIKIESVLCLLLPSDICLVPLVCG